MLVLVNIVRIGWYCRDRPGRLTRLGCRVHMGGRARLDRRARSGRRACRGRQAGTGRLTYSGCRVCPVRWAYPTDNNIF